MKAMIFAAGLGTRLKPLTDRIPKALVPIQGKPLLEHLILKLKAAGFDELVINVHHFPDQIISFLQQKNNFGLHIDISDERDMLLDTGGGLLKARRFFADEPFLAHGRLHATCFSTQKTNSVVGKTYKPARQSRRA